MSFSSNESDVEVDLNRNANRRRIIDLNQLFAEQDRTITNSSSTYPQLTIQDLNSNIRLEEGGRMECQVLKPVRREESNQIIIEVNVVVDSDGFVEKNKTTTGKIIPQ